MIFFSSSWEYVLVLGFPHTSSVFRKACSEAAPLTISPTDTECVVYVCFVSWRLDLHEENNAETK